MGELLDIILKGATTQVVEVSEGNSNPCFFKAGKKIRVAHIRKDNGKISFAGLIYFDGTKKIFTYQYLPEE